MPLPAGGSTTPWPPPAFRSVIDQVGMLAAWWEGDADKLAAVYGGTTENAATSPSSFERPRWYRPTNYRGGFVGTLQRWFWGQQTPAQSQRAKVHVPLPAEIASASTDLLFSNPITVVFGDEDARRKKRDAQLAKDQRTAEKAMPLDPNTGVPITAPKIKPADIPPDPAQVRFDQLRDQSGLDATLLEAGEVCAAMSGVYLRLVWDADVLDGPWIDVVHPDSAIPEFRFGRLSAVTFWRVISSDEDRRNGKIVRHLERHERGQILHGLYEGDKETLGRPIPLTDAPDMSDLAEMLEDGNMIRTVPGRLTACYVPNMRPAPQWRHHPQLAPLGRSDFTPGVLGMFDRLDETMSSWMRDIRLARARLQVPEQYLENQGRGQGAAFDAEKEVYTPMNILATPGSAPQITATQFKIRVQEHQATCQWIIDQAVRAAGYSASTFGSDGDGPAQTATEVNAKSSRSAQTREKKSRYWDAELTQLCWTWLLLDYELAKGPKAKVAKGTPAVKRAPSVQPAEPPEVTFPPLAQADILTLAQTAQALFAANAASKYTLVQLVHPTWDEDQIQEELSRIGDDAQEAAGGGDMPPPEGMGGQQPLPGQGAYPPGGADDGSQYSDDNGQDDYDSNQGNDQGGNSQGGGSSY